MKLNYLKFSLTLGLILAFSTAVFAQQSEREKAVELYQKGDYQNAAESLQKVVEADKKDREAWLFLGMALAKQKQKKSALKAFRQADKLKENSNSSFKITTKPRVSYTDSARQNQTQGIIKLVIEFGADGKIKSIIPLQVLPNGLTENAINAAQGIKFEPAVKDGKPITTVKIIFYTFEIY